MTNDSLEMVAQTLLIYISAKFPRLTHWKTDSLSILVFDMYSNIMKDLDALDENILLARHFREKPLSKESGKKDAAAAPSVILRVERINKRNEFALSSKGDLITSWYEYDNGEMN